MARFRLSAVGVIVALAALVACEGTSTSHRTRRPAAGASSGGDATGGRAGLGGGAGRGGSGLGSTGGSGASSEGGAPDTTGGAPGGEGGEGTATGGIAGTTSGGAGAGAGAGGNGGGGSGAAGAAGSAGGPCGGVDEPCCRGTDCTAADTECIQILAPVLRNLCVSCGVPGAPCCTGTSVREHVPRECDGGCCVRQRNPTDWRCIAPGDACPIGGACQADGSCENCGGIGAPCCDERPGASVWCTATSSTCVFDESPLTCQPCGGLDERCCYNTEDSFPTSHCVVPLLCDSSSDTCRPRPP